MDSRILRFVTFAVMLHSSCSLSYPHIFSRGTHYEVGFDIGSTFKDRIQEYYNKHPLLYSKFLPWSETPHGEHIIQGFITTTQLQFPLILNEIEGIADGAGVTFLETFMLCYTMEIAALLGEKVQNLEPDSCSDVYFNYPATKQVVIGHNEDTYPMIKNLGYFVTAHIIERDDQGKITSEEQFTHFTYPGVVPGNAFGFNSAGVVQTVNALYPEDVLINKTGRYILTRALLAAKDMDDVKRILYNEGYGVAYGVNLNIGLLPTSANKISAAQLWTVEVAPNAQHNCSLLDIMNITASYYHVNKYRRIKIAENHDKIVSSIHRTTRIEEYPIPKSTKDILSILGDTKDPDYPIYRTPRPTDPGSTVATAVFDLTRRVMQVYKDRPSNSSYGPIITLPLDFAV